MNNINNWNEELTIGIAISNIIDLEKRYFILQDRINKAIEFIENNTPNLSNAEVYDLLEILKGDNNEC